MRTRAPTTTPEGEVEILYVILFLVDMLKIICMLHQLDSMPEPQAMVGGSAFSTDVYSCAL